MSSLHPDYIDAAEMLPMPKATRLAERRIKGSACVWCGTAGALLRLGVRLSVIDSGKLARWFPRGCPECVREEAARVYQLHLGTCQRCAPRQRCVDARALYELAKPPPVSRADEPIREG